jgi:hypothetical protein
MSVLANAKPVSPMVLRTNHQVMVIQVRDTDGLLLDLTDVDHVSCKIEYGGNGAPIGVYLLWSGS